MDKDQAKHRISKLKKLINRHRYLYHVLDKQEISESALDSLKKELFDLEQEYPDLRTADSPTQRIGGKPLEQFKKYQHSQPMLSFNDGFFEQDIKDWQARIEKLLSQSEKAELDYFASLKVDGLAVSLVYQKGVFKKGATRGDGRVGEDVSQNLKTIESIPLMLNKKIDCCVRGEVYIKKKDFEELNRQRAVQGETLYANPRNTAAGSIRQLDQKIASDRKLNFTAWQMLDKDNSVQEQKELKELGFKAVNGKHCANLSAVFDYYRDILRTRQEFPYQIDGLVIKVNDNKLFQKLGIVGKAPRGAIAFKFPLKQAQTIVEDIRLQVGRTGAATPVAHLKPVKIGGTTVTRATLHNQDEIKRLDVRIGDTVIVGRAGDVIPDIIKVLKEMRTGREKVFQMPDKCPVCNSRLVKPANEVVSRCPNPGCQARQKRYFSHFVSKKAFDIEGLGPKIVEQLFEQGLISDPADLFELKQGDILPLDRFAEKSAQNLIKALEQKKNISLARFIYALGIGGVGEETAVVLAEHFGDLENLVKANEGQLRLIQDIGPETAKSIYSFFRNQKNIDFIKRLSKAGIRIKEQKTELKTRKLAGKVFVLTGSLEKLTRDQTKQRIRALAGDISSAVSKKTDYLVVGADPGSKLSQAQKLGVRIINEQEFLEMVKA